jgi:hypothetical protein
MLDPPLSLELLDELQPAVANKRTNGITTKLRSFAFIAHSPHGKCQI